MNDVLLVFLSLSVSGSILALLVLAIKPIIKKRLSQIWQYYIWLIVILRFLLPITPQISLIGELSKQFQSMQITLAEIYEEKPADGKGIYTADHAADTFQALNQVIKDSVTEGSEKASVQHVVKNNIWVIWLVIAFILFAHKIMGYYRFIQLVRGRTEQVTNPACLGIYNNELKTAKVRRKLPLYVNEEVISPMLIGFFRTAIIIPTLSVNDEELRQIFRHELTHYKRADAVYKWLVQIVLCLHWFNPLVYWMNKEISRSCELSCDESVIKIQDMNSRIIYGDALMASLDAQPTHRKINISLTMGEDANFIKERLDIMMNYKKKSRFAVCVTFLLTILFLCSFSFLGAFASSPAHSGKTANGYVGRSAQLETIDSAYILNSYYSYNGTDAYRLIKSNALKRFLDQWTDASIVNPVWNYDSFTKYEGKDLYYCTFTADNGKYYYMILQYDAADGGGLRKVRYSETPYYYDLRANIDEIALKLSMTEVDLSSAVASRLQVIDTDKNRSDEAIRITDGHGHSYMYYFGKTTEQDRAMDTAYKEWGVTYKDGAFYFDNKKIRILMDINTDNSFRNFFYDKNGSVDLRMIRNSKGTISNLEYIPEDEADEILRDFDGSSLSASNEAIPDLMDRELQNSEDIIRQTTEELPKDIKKAIAHCDNKMWYVLDGQDRRYVFYKGLTRDYAFQYDADGNRIVINDIGKSTNNYVLLSVPLSSDLKIVYNSRSVSYIKITMS